MMLVICEFPLFILLAAMSFFGATILNSPVKRRIAFGCGCVQIAAIVSLFCVVVFNLLEHPVIRHTLRILAEIASLGALLVFIAMVVPARAQDGDGVVGWPSSYAGTLTISTGDANFKAIVTLHHDGTVSYDGFTPDEAAQAFWNAVAARYCGRVPQ